jgi:hypothetical protein
MRESLDNRPTLLAGLCTDPRRLRGDLVLLRRAILQGWISSITHGQAAVDATERAAEMLDDLPESRLKARATLRLAEVYLAMDGQNLALFEQALAGMRVPDPSAYPPRDD